MEIDKIVKQMINSELELVKSVGKEIYKELRLNKKGKNNSIDVYRLHNFHDKLLAAAFGDPRSLPSFKEVCSAKDNPDPRLANGLGRLKAYIKDKVVKRLNSLEKAAAVVRNEEEDSFWGNAGASNDVVMQTSDSVFNKVLLHTLVSNLCACVISLICKYKIYLK